MDPVEWQRFWLPMTPAVKKWWSVMVKEVNVAKAAKKSRWRRYLFYLLALLVAAIAVYGKI